MSVSRCDRAHVAEERLRDNAAGHARRIICRVRIGTGAGEGSTGLERCTRGRIYFDGYREKDAAREYREPKDIESSGNGSRCVSTSGIKVGCATYKGCSGGQQNCQNRKVSGIWSQVRQFNLVNEVLTYKQVFDVVGPSNVLAPAFAMNFITGTKEATNAPDSDITAVMVYRYYATALMLADDVWAKYKLGEVLDVKDPRTGAHALRNIARQGPPPMPAAAFDQLMSKNGVILVACNHALTVISRTAAAKASVTPEQAQADFLAGLIPGVHRSASGVYAVNRAQQAGATYCFAGTV